MVYVGVLFITAVVADAVVTCDDDVVVISAADVDGLPSATLVVVFVSSNVVIFVASF